MDVGPSLEQEIVSLYDSNLKSLYSINQISKKLKKTYPYINKKVTDLVNAKVFHKIVVGRSHLCSLNLSSDRTKLLLMTNEMRKKRHFCESTGISVDEIFACFGDKVLPHTIIAVPPQNTIYVVSDMGLDFSREHVGPYALKVIDHLGLRELLGEKEHSMFTDHVVLYGSERFLDMVIAQEKRLGEIYSPLVIA